jgi:hypothetical protein
MTLHLSEAAEYIRLGQIPKALRDLFRRLVRIFTFAAERENRIVRYKKIIEEYKGEASVESIAMKYGCSKSTVLRYARLAGLDKRVRSDDPERWAKIIAFKAKLPQSEIAKRVKCSVSLVSMVEHKAGLNRYG